MRLWGSAKSGASGSDVEHGKSHHASGGLSIREPCDSIAGD